MLDETRNLFVCWIREENYLFSGRDTRYICWFVCWVRQWILFARWYKRLFGEWDKGLVCLFNEKRLFVEWDKRFVCLLDETRDCLMRQEIYLSAGWRKRFICWLVCWMKKEISVFIGWNNRFVCLLDEIKSMCVLDETWDLCVCWMKQGICVIVGWNYCVSVEWNKKFV